MTLHIQDTNANKALARQSINIGLFIIGFAAWVTYVAVKRIEAEFFPVVTPIEIVEVREHPDGVQITARAEKLRDCNYRSIRWWFGGRGGNNVPVYARFDSPPEVRGLGVLEWDAIIVGVRVDEVPDTFADVKHDCYNGYLWLTTSHYFNGARS